MFPLNGLLILVAEDEPLIALDVAGAILDHGGRAIEVDTCAAAFEAVEHHRFDAAIIDHALLDGVCDEVCSVLREEGVPYVVYSGHALEALKHLGGVALTKPSPSTTLIERLGQVLAASPRQPI
jgi:CheY-like chemotaxis protein